MERQERWRRRYARMRPDWTPTTMIYAGVVDEVVGPGCRMLDVGCGHSALLASSIDRGGHAVGMDVDLAALSRNAFFRSRVAGNAERLPFGDDSFDLVVMAWVLEHLARPIAVFREIHRVLSPGGRVAFVTPNAWNYNAWLIRLVPNRLHGWFTFRLYGRSAEDTYPTAYRLNTVAAMDRTLARIGFERERLVLNGDPTYIAFNRPLFRLGVALERLLDLPWFRRARVHIVAVYRVRAES